MLHKYERLCPLCSNVGEDLIKRRLDDAILLKQIEGKKVSDAITDVLRESEKYVLEIKEDCPICQGSGIVLTDEGKDLVEFIKRHIAINVFNSD